MLQCKQLNMKIELLGIGLIVLLLGCSLLLASSLREVNKPLEVRDFSAGHSVYLQPKAPLYIIKETRNYTALAEKIKQCESGGDPKACNERYGCGSGMGLFQLIPSTVKYCEKKLGRDIDPFNADDNTACAMWLLRNEGTEHWGTPTSTWGSYDCFSPWID